MSTLPKLKLYLSKNWIESSQFTYNENINTDFQGPNVDTNWLIPGLLLVGGYPKTIKSFEALREAGVKKYVCLNDDYDSRFNYDKHIIDNESFVHFPIEDMSTAINDNDVYKLCNSIARDILEGTCTYVHCTGGHGRTGIIACTVLSILYSEYSLTDLFDYVQYAHDQRVANYFGDKASHKYITNVNFRRLFAYGQVPTPQTTEQRNQVERVVEIHKYMV